MRNVILLPILLLSSQLFLAQSIEIVAPLGSGSFGDDITVLPNGNYVVTDPSWDDGTIIDVGAVYLYDGTTNTLISTLTGSTDFDRVGINGVTVLSNGNYVVSSPLWDNGAVIDAGAVTWGDGTTGVSGVVSDQNSLVGNTDFDRVGNESTSVNDGITVLDNGNYVVTSSGWDNGAATDVGAVTWGDGTIGVSGVISNQNSLVGSTDLDRVGNGGITVLVNGNYVVSSLTWDNGTVIDAGAVTWGDGTIGVSGVVSNQNSLVGSTDSDRVGNGNVISLNNGNYIVRSLSWDNGAVIDAGAVTWGDGTLGISGVISDQNSLVGSSNSDQVGFRGVTSLSNGNYVVSSPLWDNGAVSNAGAVTWGDGTIGVSGVISDQNSLVGSSSLDQVGRSGVTSLSNGNYLVISPLWNNGAVTDAGAVTWGDGTLGVSGVISDQNSLVGSTAGDLVGSGFITVLTNGNYVVSSPSWDNGTVINAGAVTWGSGTTGVSGIVSNQNSLVGSSSSDQVGVNGIIALNNGNYVVSSLSWNNGAMSDAGAVTWGDGILGVSGIVSDQNSLVGSTDFDVVGNGGIIALNNGNYVVSSPAWNNLAVNNAGAVTWGDGTLGVSGVISDQNSLVGSTAGDQVGNGGITALNNGNYAVSSLSWNDGGLSEPGAVTWGDGTLGISGMISDQNSLVGSTDFDQVGNGGITALDNGNYIVSSRFWNNGAVRSAGAVTWGDGTIGISGAVSNQNSLVGSTQDDFVGSNGSIIALNNGNYVVKSSDWNNGGIDDAGAVTLGNVSIGISGLINSCNSVLGNIVNGGFRLNPVFNEISNKLLVGKPAENAITILEQTDIVVGDDLDMETRAIGANQIVEFIEPNCELIANLAATGTNPVSGDVNAIVWIEDTQPTNYVKRHYEITPDNNAATATGEITLYFTQSEFDDFNAVSPTALPTEPNDAIGIANLLVEKRSGTSNDGTGLPVSYTGAINNIDPDDADIVWNSQEMRWEVTFEVTGFSGFFIKTQAPILPVELLNFKAEAKGGNSLLTWQTASEKNNKGFFIERSENGKIWKDLSFIAGGGTTLEKQNYSFTDEQPLSSINYYRLRQIDFNGALDYSEIEVVSFDAINSPLQVLPNPILDIVTIGYRSKNHNNILVQVLDLTGKVVFEESNLLKMGENRLTYSLYDLAAGTYILKVQSSQRVDQMKVVKL